MLGFPLLLLAVGYAAAKPNECCSNGGGLMENGTCVDGGTPMASTMCNSGAFMITKDDEQDGFDVEEDDVLRYRLFRESTIDPYNYCLGTFGEKNSTVALVCFIDSNLSEPKVKYIVRIICCLVSILCLLATLAVYIMLPNLRDLQGKCLMLSISSLTMSFIFLSSVQQNGSYSYTSCVSLAFLVYFWFLSTFTWLNVVSVNLMLSILQPKWYSKVKSIFVFYNIYGWGVPITFLVAALVAHHVPGDHVQPRFGVSKCWFHGDVETWIFFYGPITILLVSNLVMFIVTIWTLVKKENVYASTKLRSHKFKCMLYMKLFCIMGVLWIFEPISAIPGVQEWKLWIVTDCLNSLQGILIFLLLVVFRKRVRRDLGKKGFVCCSFMESWTTINEDCEELDEDKNDIASNTVTVS